MRLNEVFLVNNKVSEIQGVEALTALTSLELG
jgi:hypothetical protein